MVFFDFSLDFAFLSTIHTLYESLQFNQLSSKELLFKICFALFVVNFHSLGVPILKFQLVNSFFFSSNQIKKLPNCAAGVIGSVLAVGNAKTDVDKIIKKRARK